MADVGAWFNSLPFFTRYWFGGTVAASLLGRFGILPPSLLILTYQQFIHQFHLWRPITALFFYPISPQTGFHFLINLYFLVNYSRLLETVEFAMVPADYAFLLLFTFGVSVISALFMNMMVLMDPMVLCVLYIWCQLNKDTIVSFWFGTQFKAMYLPWVLFGFNMIISGGGVAELMGILIGHLYYFMKFQYPAQYGGASLISTPGFLENWFPGRRGGPVGGGAGAAGGGAARGGGHSWGRGNTLN